MPDNTEIKLELLDFEVESHAGFRLAPTLPPPPSIEEGGVAVAAFDDKTYQTDAFWPGSPVTMELEGYIRDQRVAQLQFYPVQYNPVQEKITVYKRMLVRVNFLRSPKNVQGITAESARANYDTSSDTSFKQVLTSLVVNPGDLKRSVVTLFTSPFFRLDSGSYIFYGNKRMTWFNQIK